MSNNITKGLVLRYMRKALKKYNCNPHHTLITETLKGLVDSGFLEGPSGGISTEFYSQLDHQNHPIVNLLVESYMHLLIRGLIIPRPNPPDFGDSSCWNKFICTDLGTAWANQEAYPIPEDLDGYITYIQNSIPDIDGVIFQYLEEAIQTYNSSHFFASAVMLGAAAEKVIYLLSDEIIRFELESDLKKIIEEALERRRSLKALLDTLPRAVDILIEKHKMPYNVHEGNAHHLASLFESIRVQRNDAIHPIVGRVDDFFVHVQMIILSISLIS